MAIVPAGTFQMGCLQRSGCSRDELPVREVTISGRFALSKHEITFADWDACVDAGGCDGYVPDDEGWGRGRRPVIHVDWDDAQSYVSWLSGSTGATYRLPSEAEWEYAARAGTRTRYNWGDQLETERANCRDESCRGRLCEYRARPALSPPTPGVCTTCTATSSNGCGIAGTAVPMKAPRRDGSAWLNDDCTSSVIRGGAWSSSAGNLRSANRTRDSKDDRGSNLGFRVARALPPAHPGSRATVAGGGRCGAPGLRACHQSLRGGRAGAHRCL